MATSDTRPEGSAASQMRQYLDQCTLAYDKLDVYSFVFENRDTAREFYQFIETSYKHNKRATSSPRIDELPVKDKIYYRVDTTLHRWHADESARKAFEFDVNAWALDHKSRWLTGPEKYEVEYELAAQGTFGLRRR